MACGAEKPVTSASLRKHFSLICKFHFRKVTLMIILVFWSHTWFYSFLIPAVKPGQRAHPCCGLLWAFKSLPSKNDYAVSDIFTVSLTCWGLPSYWLCWRRGGRVARPCLGNLGRPVEWEPHLSPLDQGLATWESGLELSVWAGALHEATWQSGRAEEQLALRHNSSLSSPVSHGEA